MHSFWDNGWNDMMDFGAQTSGWFILYDLVKFLIIVGVVIFLARMFMKNYGNNSKSSPNKAIEILKERYAAGEISDEEYKSKLNKLKG